VVTWQQKREREVEGKAAEGNFGHATLVEDDGAVVLGAPEVKREGVDDGAAAAGDFRSVNDPAPISGSRSISGESELLQIPGGKAEAAGQSSSKRLEGEDDLNVGSPRAADSAERALIMAFYSQKREEVEGLSQTPTGAAAQPAARQPLGSAGGRGGGNVAAHSGDGGQQGFAAMVQPALKQITQHQKQVHALQRAVQKLDMFLITNQGRCVPVLPEPGRALLSHAGVDLKQVDLKQHLLL
jgi:hypothetical protein